MLFIFLLSSSIYTKSYAQETKKDSLLNLIENGLDSEKSAIYLAISKEVSHSDSILKYGTLSLKWAKKFNIKEQLGNAYKSVGASYHIASHYNKALLYYDSALTFLSKETQANAIARTYSNKCGIYIRFNSLDSAILYNDLCKKYSALTTDKYLDRVYLRKKANIYTLQGKYKESILVSKEILLDTGLSTKSLIINLQDIGINFFDLGQIDSALYYYDLIYDLGNAVKPNEEITLLNNKANAYIFISDHENSIKCYLKAIAIADSINYKYGHALIKSNLANLYFEWGEFKKAIQVYKESIVYLEEFGVLTNLAINYINIGIAYNSLGIIDSSIIYLEKSKKICIQTDNLALLSTVYHNIGRYHMEKEEYWKSIEYYHKALKANSRDHNRNTKANVYHDMALSYSGIEKYKMAMSFADSAKTIYHKIGNTKQAIDIELSIALIMEKNKNYKGAYERLKLYMYQKDTLFNAEKYKQLNELETKYNIAQKEKEIQAQLTQIAEGELLLKGEKNKALTYAVLFAGAAILLLLILIFLLRNKQKHQLVKNKLESHQMELEGRLLRSQMNPHFIFNSLNSIQSYITSNDQYNAETYLSKFAKLMRSILENSRHAFVSLDQDLSTLMIYIELEHLRFEGQFTYKIDISDDIELENTYIAPMLIQPYIENAIIHGLVGKTNNDGRLLLKFEIMNNSSLKCTIEDNGIGRERARDLRKRSVKPYKSLGMQVTKERMEVISKINKVSFEEKFTDLTNNLQDTSGTRVELIIPFEKD